MTFIKILLLENYCKEIKTDKFWIFTFVDKTFETLPREPAHSFLQLVSSTSCLYLSFINSTRARVFGKILPEVKIFPRVHSAATMYIKLDLPLVLYLLV